MPLIGTWKFFSVSEEVTLSTSRQFLIKIVFFFDLLIMAHLTIFLGFLFDEFIFCLFWLSTLIAFIW